MAPLLEIDLEGGGSLISLKAVYVIVLREFKRFFRQRGRLMGTIARPMLWLVIIGSGLTELIKVRGEVSYMEFMVPGVIGMTILFSSVFSTISVVWDREFGFLREMMVAPISRFTIVLGKLLSGTMLSVFQGFILLLLVPLFGIQIHAVQFLKMILLMFIVSLSITSLGLLIASFLTSLEGFNVIMNFMVLPMFFLSGALYPIKVLPSPLLLLTRINPLTYGIDSFKHVMLSAGAGSILGTDFTLRTDIIFVLIFSIIMVFFTSLSFQRRD